MTSMYDADTLQRKDTFGGKMQFYYSNIKLFAPNKIKDLWRYGPHNNVLPW